MPATVQGVARLTSTLDGALDVIQTEGPQAAAHALEPAVQAAIPRKTGALAATVVVQVSKGLVSVQAGSNAVRYGFRAAPAITRTIDQKRQDVLDAYTEVADQALSRVQGA